MFSLLALAVVLSVSAVALAIVGLVRTALHKNAKAPNYLGAMASIALSVLEAYRWGAGDSTFAPYVMAIAGLFAALMSAIAIWEKVN